MTENTVATNINSSADSLIEKAVLVRDLVNELGDDWASDAYGEVEISARHAALRSLTDYAVDLYKRAAEKRYRAFQEVTKS